MEKNVKISILCQLYGKLLSEKQLEFIDDYYNNDLSLSEIAENHGITRQAVRDMLKKGEKKLFEYEEKLLFMKRMLNQEKKIEEILLELTKIQKDYTPNIIPEVYQKLLQTNAEKINENAANIEKIAITETVTVTSKVKDIFKELIKKPRFIFSKLCSAKKYTRLETVTAFSGILELTRRNKIKAQQERNFGDIIVEKASK